MLNGMLSSFRPSKRLAEAPEPTSGAFSIWEDTRMENAPLVGSGASASLLLGRKLDSIPFSIYHVQIILVLGVVGFVEGYDVALGGSLLVLAKEPLHLTPEQIRWLAVAPILFLVLGAFTAASIS